MDRDPAGSRDDFPVEELDALARFTSDPLFGSGADLRLRWWNPALERALGRPPGELARARLDDFVARTDRAALQATLEETRRRGEGSGTLQLLTATGTRPHRLQALRPDTQAPDRIVGCLRDVSGIEESEAERRRIRARLQSMADSAIDGVIMLDAEGRVIFWNRAAEALFGYSAEEILGEDLHLALAPERYHADYLEGFRRFRETGEGNAVGRRLRLRARHRDGHEMPIELSLGALREDGEWHALGFVRDISETVAREQALERANQALRTLSRVNATLVRATDERSLLEGICRAIVETADYALAWVGFARDDPERSIDIVSRAGDDRGYVDQLRVRWGGDALGLGPAGQAIRTGQASITRHTARCQAFAPWREAAQERGYQSVIGLPLTGPGHETPMGVLCIYSREPDTFDTHEVKVLTEAAEDLAFGLRELRLHAQHQRTTRQLAFLAQHDAVTGLPNRREFLHVLELAAEQAREHAIAAALLILNLRHFRLINDTAGHGNGDAVLAAVARRLRQRLRDNDTVARLGGDEFAVLVTLGEMPPSGSRRSRKAAERVATKVADCFERPFPVAGEDTYIAASIGITLVPTEAGSPQELLAQADAAMHRAKQPSGTPFVFYSPELARHESGRRLSMEGRLHDAVKRRDFTLHYQPVVELESGRLSGAEALIRWPQKDGSLVSPGEFIPLAEELGMIVPIGQWVVETACEQVRQWRERAPDFRLAVNLSPVQLLDRAAMGRLLRTLDEADLPPGALEFELTEGALVGDPGMLMRVLRELHERGMSLAIDDFGTGYSSMSRIKEMPLETLKIDKSFVDGLPDNCDDVSIARAIVGMGDALQLRCLAEGIETGAQWAFMREHGCHFGQGYHFSRPIPGGDFEATLLGGHRWPLPEVGNGAGSARAMCPKGERGRR